MLQLEQEDGPRAAGTGFAFLLAWRSAREGAEVNTPLGSEMLPEERRGLSSPEPSG